MLFALEVVTVVPAGGRSRAVTTSRTVPLRSSITSSGQPSAGSPDSASEQLKRTRTALLSQPAALALRAVPSSLTAFPLMVGAVRSMLTGALEVGADTLPALSLTVAGPAFRPSPSPMIVLLGGTEAGSTPDRPS